MYNKSGLLTIILVCVQLTVLAQIKVRLFYDSTQGKKLREEYAILDIRDSVKDGPCIKYYPSGKTQLTGQFKEGKKSGQFIEYFENGKPMLESWFQDGKKEGPFKTYYPDGKLSQKSLFKGNKMQDTVVAYYPDGSIKSVSVFKDDWPDGVVKHYYESGQLKMEEFYTNGKPNGFHNEYYKSGKPSIKSFFKNGQLTGTYTTYYPNGQVETESVYDEGEKNGYYRSYTKKGVKVLEGNYLNGKIEGPNLAWYPDGKPRHELKYRQGVLCCEAKYYHPNGSLKQSIRFGDKPEDKKVKDFNLLGQLVAESELIANRATGTWKTYHPTNGRVRSKETYNDNGKVEGTKLFYDSLGNKVTEEPYINGVKTGLEFHYFGKSGKLEAEYTYKANVRSGPYRKLNEQGIVIESGLYRQDLLNGKVSKFDNQGKLVRTEWYQMGSMSGFKDMKPNRPTQLEYNKQKTAVRDSVQKH